MKKCIIFSRVSSDSQSFDEQTLRLRQLAEESGYHHDDHIVIEYKESGIRLKEEERLGLTEMKEIISTDPSIDCVFAFEISRIARTKKVLFSIQEFLVERHIQLVIYEPRITMLNHDGTINDSADFAFTMYAQYAESEMRQKKERFKNGRERARKLGHWNGGRCLFGFRIEAKKMIPDESTAYIVRRCFEMYATGASQEYVAKYLDEFGIHRRGHNLAVMLRNPKYVELVGQKLFDAVQAAKTGRRQPGKYRIYSLGEKLLVCPHCGRHYVHITNCYICLGRLKPYKDCEHGFSIKDEIVDRCLVTFSKYTYASRLAVEKRDDEERLRKALDEFPRKIEVQNALRRKLYVKKNRIIEVYTDGTIERSEYDRRLREIDRMMQRSDEAAAELIAQQTQIRTSLEDIRQGKRTIDATLDSFDKASRRELYELVHQEVQDVEMLRDSKYKYLQFNMKAGFTNSVRTSGQGCSFKVEWEVNGKWENFDK